jgi:hypothetical protein
MARIQQAREENEDEEMEDIDKDEMQSTNNPQRYASRKARYGLTPMLDLPFSPRPKFSKLNNNNRSDPLSANNSSIKFRKNSLGGGNDTESEDPNDNFHNAFDDNLSELSIDRRRDSKRFRSDSYEKNLKAAVNYSQEQRKLHEQEKVREETLIVKQNELRNAQLRFDTKLRAFQLKDNNAEGHNSEAVKRSYMIIKSDAVHNNDQARLLRRYNSDIESLLHEYDLLTQVDKEFNSFMDATTLQALIYQSK